MQNLSLLIHLQKQAGNGLSGRSNFQKPSFLSIQRYTERDTHKTQKSTANIKKLNFSQFNISFQQLIFSGKVTLCRKKASRSPTKCFPQVEIIYETKGAPFDQMKCFRRK